MVCMRAPNTLSHHALHTCVLCPVLQQDVQAGEALVQVLAGILIPQSLVRTLVH